LPITGAWYDPFGECIPCAAAYRTLGVVTYDIARTNIITSVLATESNGAVPWGKYTGFVFTAADLKALVTDVVPPDTQDWTFIVRYTVVPVEGMSGHPFGAGKATKDSDPRIYVEPAVGDYRWYSCGRAAQASPSGTHLTGTMGLIGPQGYRDGLIDNDVSPCIDYNGVMAAITLGARNHNVPVNFFNGTLAGFAAWPFLLRDDQYLAVHNTMMGW
jgi:hypothetical protein